MILRFSLIDIFYLLYEEIIGKLFDFWVMVWHSYLMKLDTFLKKCFLSMTRARAPALCARERESRRNHNVNMCKKLRTRNLHLYKMPIAINYHVFTECCTMQLAYELNRSIKHIFIVSAVSSLALHLLSVYK